jgi:hypothetical protein
MSVLGKAHYVARERMDIVGRRISGFFFATDCHIR